MNIMETEGINQRTNNELVSYLVKEGIVCYIPSPVDFDLFIDKMVQWMADKLKLQVQYNKLDSLYQIEYQHKAGITNTLGLSMGFRLILYIEQNKLLFDVKSLKWFESRDSKYSLLKLVNDPYDTEIKAFIFDYFNGLGSEPGQLKIDNRNHFIENLNEQRKTWFQSNLSSDELLLVFLEISPIKKDSGTLKADKELSWNIFFSSKKAGIIAFNSRNEVVQHAEIEPEKFKVKNEIGRNPLYVNEHKLLSLRSNGDLFYHVQTVCKLKTVEKLKEIARLNWLYQEKNEPSNQFAIEMQQLVVSQTNDPFDGLALFYMEFSKGNREKVFAEYIKDEKLSILLTKILNHLETQHRMQQWIQQWNISYIDSAALNNLFTSTMENAVQANNILPFHRLVRENFLKKNKDELNEIVFDIGFSKHLIKCGFENEAKKILKKRLEQLPDETLSDLLPERDSDISSSKSGQILKINILEILSGLEKEKESIHLKCQIARLQPLVESRIEQLIKVSEQKISSKGIEIKEILLPAGMIKSHLPISPGNYKPLEDSFVEKNIKFPPGRKNGNFSGFQKWLASVKIPDLSVLKSYTEKLSPQKYPQLIEIVSDIKHTLKLENIEIYISQGDKSVGITGFESNPQFIIIGGDHLNPDSPNYLNHNELKFAIGVELAHLYFKHARITSSDMWKGAMEKGYFVVDTILSIFPAVGIFSKSLQTIGRLNEISSFLQKTEKIGKVTARSRDIFKNSEQIVSIYKSKFSSAKNENEQELEFLATFRMMQLTADRCAFVFVNDLKSAIRAMFLVSKKYYTELPLIEKYGLREFLLKQNEQGVYLHQELAIRLSGLFSFYLSEEYEEVIEKLEK